MGDVMSGMQFEVIDKNYNKIICDVIATYHDDLSNKDFIVYTDNTYDKNNQLMIYYSLYKYVNNSISLIEITDLEDKKIGLQLVQELLKDINK